MIGSSLSLYLFLSVPAMLSHCLGWLWLHRVLLPGPSTFCFQSTAGHYPTGGGLLSSVGGTASGGAEMSYGETRDMGRPYYGETL